MCVSYMPINACGFYYHGKLMRPKVRICPVLNILMISCSTKEGISKLHVLTCNCSKNGRHPVHTHAGYIQHYLIWNCATNSIDSSIISIAQNMVLNNVVEPWNEQYKQQRPQYATLGHSRDCINWRTDFAIQTPALPSIIDELRCYGQELSSNTYIPQLIQQTTVTSPIKCSWEALLNKHSLHVPVQGNL